MENKGLLERVFKLSEHNTTVGTEVIAGLTTFMAMAYILAVNPNILSQTGMDFGGVFTATALSALLATLVMGLYANLPFALAPGMGLNAFFAYTIVMGMGYSWQFALTAVFIEGLIFLFLTIFNIREAILNSIPLSLKKAIAAGIGLFITFIGLYNAGAGIIIQGKGIPLDAGNVTAGAPLVTVIGLIITGTLLARNVRGSLFIGIIITTIVGIPFGVTHLPSSAMSTPPTPIFMAFEWTHLLSLDFLFVLFTFLFIDMFDTAGTLIGVATKTGMLDREGNVPNAKKALFADAIGTTIGACIGTSTVTTYVESTAGVAEGGRTGLSAVVTAILFALALFFAPLFAIVPSAATAPALILIGLFMLSPIQEIDLEDYSESIPAFLTLVMMPLTYSIANGIMWGITSFIIFKVCSNKYKDIPLTTYIVALFFIIKLVLPAVMGK